MALLLLQVSGFIAAAVPFVTCSARYLSLRCLVAAMSTTGLHCVLAAQTLWACLRTWHSASRLDAACSLVALRQLQMGQYAMKMWRRVAAFHQAA